MDSNHGDSDASAGHSRRAAAGATDCPSLPAGAPASAPLGSVPQFHFIPVPAAKVPAVLQVLGIGPQARHYNEPDSSGSIWAKARGPIAGLVLFATATAAALGGVGTLGPY